jgi:predicted nucleotidyltransferase
MGALQDVLGGALVGAYLHGSAVLGGLRPESDIDVLAVSTRRTTRDEKRRTVARLLAVSGAQSAAATARPVELTIVVWSEIRPWRYPPKMDFQYGEWWRESFSQGELEPWASRTNRDVAPLVTMVLLGEATLFGPQPSEVFDPVPDEDFIDALVASIGELLDDIDHDTRNVILTLARIWSGVVTGAVRSKDAAAEWALPRLAPEHRPVLGRARSFYLGAEEEDWDSLRGRIPPFVEAVVAEIETAASRRRPPIAPSAHP